MAEDLASKENRRLRNQRYYEKKKVEATKVVTLFAPGTSDPRPSISATDTGLLFDLMPVLLLSLGLSYVLITETVAYFTEMDGHGFTSVLKGILCEGIVIGFSLFRFQNFWRRMVQRFVVFAACLYSLWAISSGVVMTASHQYRESVANQEAITAIESQIKTSESMLAIYQSRDWLGALRREQGKLDVLREKLSEARQHSIQVKPKQLVVNTVLNSVLFRLIVLISNILCLKRLSELAPQFGLRLKRSRLARA